MQLLQPIVFSKRQNSYSSVFALWGKIDTSLMLKQWCLMQNHDCAQIQPGCSRLVRRALADKHRVLQCNYFSGNYPCWSSSQRWMTARLPFVGSAAAKFKALCSIGVAAKVKTVPSRIEHIIFISNYKNKLHYHQSLVFIWDAHNLLVFFSETNLKCLMITSEKHQIFQNCHHSSLMNFVL